MRRALVLSTLLAFACGPADTGNGGGVDAYTGQTATVTGRVWAPMQGPGQALPGEEIPIFGALVYASVAKPDPIPSGVYCEKCVDAPFNSTMSSHDGSFTLPDLQPGTYWLVIQKGQFRIERQITVAKGQTLAVSDAESTLPSAHDPANGQWIPKVAVALGTNDNIEDVLGKIGLGQFDASANSLTSGAGEMDLYVNNGGFGGPATVGTVSDLFTSLDRMRQYHIIFFPCSTMMGSVTALRDETNLRNIRTYINEGGKFYVTDWSGEAMDNPFPPQIKLGGAGKDTVGTYDPIALSGSISTYGSSDGSYYDSTDAEAVDENLNQWLGLQSGPTPDLGPPGAYDANNFMVEGNYNWIEALESVLVGSDEEGLPVYDEPKAWVIGSRPASDGVKRPLSVTYQPTGCGRVLYSTYQTANGHHEGLYPQERVLLYLIMEIGVCSSVPDVE